jgi:hypothetical protein
MQVYPLTKSWPPPVDCCDGATLSRQSVHSFSSLSRTTYTKLSTGPSKPPFRRPSAAPFGSCRSAIPFQVIEALLRAIESRKATRAPIGASYYSIASSSKPSKAPGTGHQQASCDRDSIVPYCEWGPESQKDIVYRVHHCQQAITYSKQQIVIL